jgi:FixJ family two-component response regulator
VLVTDVRPGFTKGLDLARLGRSLRPHMTQLVTSDWNDPELTRDIEALGAVFLQNPVTESQLLAALYRMTLRDPNADGTVGPALTPLVRRDTKIRETPLFTSVGARSMS